MRAFLAIAARDLFERRIAFAVAALVSLIPLVLPWIPRLSNEARDEVVASGALGLAVAFFVGSAIAFGYGMWTDEISARRLDFYLARPLRAQTLWAARWLTAILSVLAGSLIVLLPGALFAYIPWPEMFLDAPRGLVVATALSALIALVAIAHLCSVLFRLPSRWSLLEFVAIALLSTFIGVSIRQAVRMWEYGNAVTNPFWVLLAFVAGFAALAGSFAQVVLGRSDPRRSRALFAIVFTIVWVIGAGAILLHLRRAIDPRIDRLDAAWGITTGATGDWHLIHALPYGAPSRSSFLWWEGASPGAHFTSAHAFRTAHSPPGGTAWPSGGRPKGECTHPKGGRSKSTTAKLPRARPGSHSFLRPSARSPSRQTGPGSPS